MLRCVRRESSLLLMLSATMPSSIDSPREEQEVANALSFTAFRVNYAADWTARYECRIALNRYKRLVICTPFTISLVRY